MDATADEVELEARRIRRRHYWRAVGSGTAHAAGALALSLLAGRARVLEGPAALLSLALGVERPFARGVLASLMAVSAVLMAGLAHDRVRSRHLDDAEAVQRALEGRL